MTIVYAVGLTHHTTGWQMIRSAAVLQLFLGNIGRPGGGMNAERGHANIQGNTDNAISWEILPGYLRIPVPGQRNLDDYVDASASKKADSERVELLRQELQEVHGQPAQDVVRRRGHEEQRVRVRLHPQAGGRTPPGSASSTRRSRARWKASSWRDDGDQHRAGRKPGAAGARQAQVARRRWTPSRPRAPSSGTPRASILQKIQTEVLMLPATHWIEKEGSFVNSGRWMQWKEQVLPPEGDARHDHWVMADLFLRVRKLYEREGGDVPGPGAGPRPSPTKIRPSPSSTRSRRR